MKKFIAEFIGTMFLVVFGCGSAIAANSVFGTWYNLPAEYASMALWTTALTIALAFGMIVVAMYYSFRNVSGCHINPAVSLGMLITGKMGAVDFVGYIISQFVGGIAGAGILLYLFGNKIALAVNGFGSASAYGLTTTLGGEEEALASAFTMPMAIVVEIILAFVFVMVFLNAASKKESFAGAGIVVGLSYAAVSIFGLFLTGAAVNPARSLGPALFARGESLVQVWVFVLFPLVGGALAALVYKLLEAKEEVEEEFNAEEFMASIEFDIENDDEEDAEEEQLFEEETEAEE